MAASDAPRGEGALEAAAREIASMFCLRDLDNMTARTLAIMRRHGLRGPNKLPISVNHLAGRVYEIREHGEIIATVCAHTPEENHD